MNSKMNTNFQEDPKFTAYALNELSDADRADFQKQMIDSGMSIEEINSYVQNIQKLSDGLREEFKKDEIVRVAPEVRESIMKPIGEKPSPIKWIMSLLAGGSVAVIATIMMLQTQQQTEVLRQDMDGALVDTLVDTKMSVQNTKIPSILKAVAEKKQIAPTKPIIAYQKPSEEAIAYADKEVSASRSRALVKGGPGGGRAAKKRKAKSFAPQGLVMSDSVVGSGSTFMPEPIEQQKADEYNREAYDKIDTNPYTLVSSQPLSTFSVDVDTASYANMRRFLLIGQLPPKDSIRVEELINYFHYENEFKFDKHPVAIKVQQSNSIWNKGRKIVKVALKADSPSNLTLAKKNLVFLLDVSGSMNQMKKLPLLKESMKLLLRKLKPTDTISLVVYAGAAGVVLEPTEAKENVKILRALDKLNAGGSTNGGAGIKAAYKMAKQAFVRDGVNRVILATDGDFNVGTSSQSALIDLIEEKAKEDIFLTVVGLGMGNYQDEMLEKISNRGNGNYAYIDSLSEANKLFNIDLEKNLTTVAKDVKIQIEFNPNLVQAYRLIGYENRMLAAQDFNNDKKDAGEMGAGHTVTALYEVVPVGEKFEEGSKVDALKYAKKAKPTTNAKLNDELLTVKVRYKAPTGTKSTKFEVPLKNQEREFKKMDNDFKFATAVASFGMKLRNDKMVQDLRYRDIEGIAKESKGRDQFDFREEFIEMLNLAKQIDK